jgi:benzoyl-CoA 2,3-dioxygenase component B
MVYLLHTYFGRDGREEAEELLERRSGDPTSRASSAPSTSRLPTGSPSSCSRYFTDRDGKYQLAALAESASTRWRAPAASC